ncbi:hypothetical protein [Geomicrobium sp. JCM 19037]|nr:hypothetical protein [Geomicrobium sp. JCM 19037]
MVRAEPNPAGPTVCSFIGIESALQLEQTARKFSGMNAKIV